MIATFIIIDFYVHTKRKIKRPKYASLCGKEKVFYVKSIFEPIFWLQIYCLAEYFMKAAYLSSNKYYVNFT